ncbi:hypothetical protein [Erwinia phage vB_Ea277G]|nr:hypothetical protein [Erwinia phage vB_Ea277G]
MEKEISTFEQFVSTSAGAVIDYLQDSPKAEDQKLREFLSSFYAGSQYMNLVTESSLVQLAEQVHGNLVYQNFVYDLQMVVLTPFGRKGTEEVIEHLSYGIAPVVVYDASQKVQEFAVGPTDDARFKVTDQDIANRLRANRWLLPLLVLSWAELPESTHNGTD